MLVPPLPTIALCFPFILQLVLDNLNPRCVWCILEWVYSKMSHVREVGSVKM